MSISARARLLLDGVWTDITSSVRQAQGISITAGRQDERATTAPTSCKLTINNRDGVYSPRNTSSPYYGKLGRNTPLQAGVLAAYDAFGRTVSNGIGTSDSGHVWSTAGGAASVYSVSSGSARIAAAAVNTSYAAYLDGLNIRNGVFAVKAICGTVATGGPIDMMVTARRAGVDDFYYGVLRAQTDSLIDVFLAKRTGGVSSFLTTALGFPYDATTQAAMELTVQNGYLQLRAWDVADPAGTVVTIEDTDDDHTQADAAGFRLILASANTNTLPVTVQFDDFEVLDVRATVEVSAWPQRWDRSGNDVWVPIEGAGITRRLSQGAPPLRSAVRRYLEGLAEANQPVAAWCLEEGPLSGQFDPLYGQHKFKPLRSLSHPSGAKIRPPLIGRGDLGPWLPPAVSLSGSADLAGIWGYVSMPGSPSTWSVDLVYASGTDAANFTVDMNPDYLGGSQWLQLLIEPGQEEIGVAAAGEPEVYFAAEQAFDGLAHHISVMFFQSGGQVEYEVRVDGVLIGTDSTSGGLTLAPLSRIALISATQGGASAAVGYLVVWDTATSLFDTDQAALGWPGETAGQRISRLCEEEGITLVTVGDLDDTELVGPQRVASLLELLRDAESADQGILYEPRGVLGLAYRTRVSLYNQTATLTLNYGQQHLAEVPDPTDDDQATRNSVTATRFGGGSYTHQVTEGPLSTAAPPNGVGVYDEQVPVNPASDLQLPNLAGWRAHLGTWDESRWPALTVGLHRTAFASLVDPAADVDIGDLVTVEDPPSWLPPDDVNLLAQGTQETFDRFLRTITWNTTPAGPYTVPVWGSSSSATDEASSPDHYDTAGSVLAVACDDNDTSLSVATTLGQLWTEDASNLPLDISIRPQTASGGERVTVTAIANTTIAVRAAGTADTDNNASLTPGLPAGLTAGDLLLGVAGIRNTAATVTVPTGYTTLLNHGNLVLFGRIADGTESTPTVAFSGGSAGDDTIAQLAAFTGSFYDIDNLLVASGFQTNSSAQDIAYPDIAVPCDDCLIIYVGFKHDDWTSAATIASATEIGEPDSTAGNDAGLVWDRLIQTSKANIAAGSFTVTGGASAVSKGVVVALRSDVQTFTVTRSVNGVAMSHSAGDDVRLWTPPIYSL